MNHSRNGGWVALAAAALAVGGCANPGPQFAPEVRYRHESLAYAPKRIERDLATCEPNLRYTFSRIERSGAMDAQRTREWPGKLEHYIDRDVRRWEANQPTYADQIGELFEGHPDTIARNAVILFY